MMSRRPNTGGGAGYSVHEVTAKRFEVDHRAALFGGRGKRPQDPSKKNDDAKAAYSREVIEKQNNSMIEDLEAFCTAAKELRKTYHHQASRTHVVCRHHVLTMRFSREPLFGRKLHLES